MKPPKLDLHIQEDAFAQGTNANEGISRKVTAGVRADVHYLEPDHRPQNVLHCELTPLENIGCEAR